MITYLLDTLVNSIKTSLINKLGLDPSTDVDLDDFPELIDDIPIIPNIEELTVTTNGTYTAPTDGAYTPVNVNLPLGTKTVTTNGTYNASDDDLEGYTGVTVDIEGYAYTDDTTAESVKTITTSALPLTKCVVGIEAQQDLNGYDKPWAGGAGKNKFNYEDVTASTTMSQNDGTFTNTATDTKTSFDFYIQQFNEGTYVAQNNLAINSIGRKSLTFTVSSAITTLRLKHNGSTQDLAFGYPWTTQGTFTISFDVIGYNPSIVGGLSFNNVMIEAGSSATDYEPYSNICPISGWDSINTYISDDDTSNPTTITTALPSTCYGGSIDLCSGSGNVAYGYFKPNTTTTYAVLGVYHTTNGYWSGSLMGTGIITKRNASYLSSVSGTQPYSSPSSTGYCTPTGNTPIFTIADSLSGLSSSSSATEVQNAINSFLHTVQPECAYELATPTTSQLTPTQITPNEGTTNIWCNSGKVKEVGSFKAL